MPAEALQRNRQSNLARESRFGLLPALAVFVVLAAISACTTSSERSDGNLPSSAATEERPQHPLLDAGTIDGVPWKLTAWRNGQDLCTRFIAGASVLQCWSVDYGNSVPFVYVTDSPVTDGKRGSTTSVIVGGLLPWITDVRVVMPVDPGLRASILNCPCPGLDDDGTIFTLPVTKQQTAVDDLGRYTVIAAFRKGTEVGRVRVDLSNFGYCGMAECE